MKRILVFAAILFLQHLHAQNIDNVQSTNSYDWVDGNWQDTYRDSWIYDSPGHINYLQLQQWNLIAMAWDNQSQTIYNYNADGSLSGYLIKSWNNSSWEDIYRYTFTYTDGKKATMLQELYTSGNWMGLYRESYTYGSNGLILFEMAEHWDGSAWTNSSLTTSYYNSNDKLEEYVLYNWNGGAYIGVFQKLYTYDAGDKLSTVTKLNWSESSQLWINDSYSVYGYDANNFLTSLNVQAWQGGTWHDNIRYNYTNNPNGTLAIFVSQNWDSNLAVWVNFQKKVYNYAPLAVSQTDAAAFDIFPNPVQDKLTVATGKNEHASCRIFDLQGRLILTAGSFLNIANIDFTGLPPGIYMIQLEQGNTTASKKVIKN